VIITHRHKAADAHRRGPPTRPRLLECAADAPARLFGAPPEGARAVPRLALGIREMEVDLVLRGYGDPCHPPSRVALRPLEERQRSAYAIAQALCGNIVLTLPFLTLSEVLGHLDWLEADGRVREFARDGVNVCELA
jgi:hypothetical protein